MRAGTDSRFPNSSRFVELPPLDRCFPPVLLSSHCEHLLPQVVERIKSNPRETKLLVIEEAGDEWYKERGLVIRGTQANVVSHATPERLSCKDPQESEETLENGSLRQEEQVAADAEEEKRKTQAAQTCDSVKNESRDESAASSPASPSPPVDAQSRTEDLTEDEGKDSKAVSTQSQAPVLSPIVVDVPAVAADMNTVTGTSDQPKQAPAAAAFEVSDHPTPLFLLCLSCLLFVDPPCVTCLLFRQRKRERELLCSFSRRIPCVQVQSAYLPVPQLSLESLSSSLCGEPVSLLAKQDGRRG